MALDSETKRQAVPGVGRPWMRGQFPVSAKDRGWRSSVANSYPVANFQSPVAGGVVIGLIGPGGLISESGLAGRAGGLIG